MDTQDVVILDVWKRDEYDAGHIPGKGSMVLVYCPSGNRSKTASSKLAGLGYANICKFGGVSTWPYETEP